MKLLLIILQVILIVIILPVHSFAESTAPKHPAIQSETAVLIDAVSGAILYEQDSEKVMYPASLTKIVTAIMAIESGRLDETVTVSKRAREVDGTRVYLEEGEQVPLKKLVQGLMINSGNDAGVAIAEHLGGSVEGFAEMMNTFVENKVGVKDTNFENPHGLFGENHYSTAYDFALITKYAIKDPTFREIMGTSELKWVGESWDTTIYNHHWMLREWPYEGIIGGKNGYINQSGHTLVTAAQREDLTLIAVVLNATTKRMMYNDTEKLFDFGFEHFETGELIAPQEFKVDSIVYHLKENLYFTKMLKENVRQEVSQSGELTIYGEDDRVIANHTLINPLEEIDKSTIVESTIPLGDVYTEEKNNDSAVSYILLLVLFFIITSFLYLKKRRRKT
ncbi:D-alanyl-D-alanine carboxypeptidase family protein [Litchfieldia alkalitelluris]|uniref:D-alanyl-D-alanine carboxypeptidase family protein n=1 Tax=Litchfieldia alkalitelluris TaxID=304268 RepID=UPI000995DFA8|nr:D-alanyl-D-alanine carboxypeptidase family protein [Litchfieldia alkalitelluris]